MTLRHAFTGALRILFVALLLGLLWRSGIWREFDPSLIKSNLPAVAVAMALVAASLAAVSLRLQALAGRHGSVTFGQAWTANALALGVNLVVPGRLSELLKPWYLRRASGVRFSVGLSAVVLERAFDVLFLALLAVGGVLAFGAPRPLAWVVVGCAVLVGVAMMPALARAGRAVAARVLPGGLQVRVTPLFNGLDGVAERRRDWRVWLFSAAGWGLSWAAVWALLHLSLKGGIGADQALAVFVATTAGLAVSVLPGGAGTFEGAAVLTLRSFGVQPAESLALAILLRLQQAVVPLTALAVALLHDRSLFGSIRMAAAADTHAGAAGESGVEDA